MIPTPLSATQTPRFRGKSNSAQSRGLRPGMALPDDRLREPYPSGAWFNRFDPFEGVVEDPQSLHKYAYVHGNPVNMIDPTGQFGLVGGLAVGIGLLGAIGVGVGYFTEDDGGFFQSVVPGFGSGRGLGAAIAEGDPVGITVNGIFLALDLLTVGGWSAVFKGVGKPVLKGISREALEGLYQSVVNVARDPEFIKRAAQAGFSPSVIDNLIPGINRYVRDATFGITSGVSSFVDDGIFALTKRGAKSWNTIAHELTHVLDGIRNPHLLREGGATAFDTLKAEYRAFYVSTGNPFLAGANSFLQYGVVTAGNGRYFAASARQFLNVYNRWMTDRDLF